MKPDNFDRVFEAMAQRRCVSCHQQGGEASEIPLRKWYLRIADPEKNTFLRAPLAKTAGGLESCGTPVFASKEDPDYRRLLATFQPIHALLTENPRYDMMASGEGDTIYCHLEARRDQ